MAKQSGLTMVYTGDGKGKTTAAFGLVLRAVGHQQRVLVVQFMKGKPTGEVAALQQFLPQIEVVRTGRDVFVNPDSPDEIDVRLAEEALDAVRQALQRGEYDLIVLDEINVAVDYGLIREEAVLELIAQRGSATLVLTGRGATPRVQEAADLVSEVREIKHHWRQGFAAQAGIEF